MVHGELLLFAALFLEAEQKPFPGRIIVFDLQIQGSHYHSNHKTYAKPVFAWNGPKFSLCTRHFTEISKPSRSEPELLIAPTEGRLFVFRLYTQWTNSTP